MRLAAGIALGVALVGYLAPGAVPFADVAFEILRDLASTVIGMFSTPNGS